MKKIFTLTLMVLSLFTSINAMADNYRRTWDFRKGWSESTLECMAADTKHWTVQNTGFQNTGSFSELKAVMEYGGEEIAVPELEGMEVGGLKSSAHVQIYDGTANNSSFPKSACLWLNGSKSQDYVSVQVPAGENVKIGYCSHSNSQARGFKVSGNFKDAEGNQTFTSMADATIVDVELINTNTEEATLKIAATNGFHIYYIIIGDGDVVENAKIGYLYYEAAGQGFEELPLYKAIKDTEGTTFEPIKVDDGIPSAETMNSYNAIVLDGSIPANESVVSALKDNIQWQPVLNVNANLAAAFGYGDIVTQPQDYESEMVVVTDVKKSWFADATIIDDITGEGDMGYGSTNGEAFPTPLKLKGTHVNDHAYIVWMDGDGIIHNDSVISYVHNNGHNEYVYYGVDADYAEGTEIILQNILKEVVASKSDITATPKPSISGTYREMETTVTLTCLNKNAIIYYTIDGTDPTIESAVYNDKITFTTEATVKAIAVADGYTISDIASFDVELYHQAKQPIITVTYPEGKTVNDGDAIVEITSDEDVDIWYNITGSNKTTDFSTLYTGPITIKSVIDLTAFAVGKEGNNLVQSELTTESINANIANVRRDVVAHFTAAGWNTLSTADETSLVLDGEPQTAWKNGSNYYFSWGKTAAMSYENGEPKLDENGEPMFDEQTGNQIYEQIARKPEVTTNEKDKAWKLVSRGQVMVHQTNTLSKNIGNFGGYNPARAEYLENDNDIAPTSADIQFAGKGSGDVNTASIETTEKYQGPFNVLSYVANINGNKDTGEGNITKLAIEVSADGSNWNQLEDELLTDNIYRNYSKFEVSYNGTDEVYVRLRSVNGGSQGVHDIFILNNGEKSKALEEQYATGINDIETTTVIPVKAIKIIENGKLLIKTANGIFTVSGAKIK